MFQKLRIASVLVLVVLGIFVWNLDKSNAEIIRAEQLINSVATSSTIIPQTWGMTWNFTGSQSPFSGTTFNSFETFLKFNNWSSNANLNLLVTACSVQYNSITGACSGFSENYINGAIYSASQNNPLPVDMRDVWVYVSTTTPHISTATTTGYMRWVITCSGTNANCGFAGSVNDFAYPFAGGFVDLSNYTSMSSYGVADPYFRIGLDLDPPLQGNTVRITFPVTGYSFADFARWGLQYNFSTTTPLTYGDFVYGVRYGTSSSVDIRGVLDEAIYTDQVFLSVLGFSSTTIAKTVSPPVGDYYAQGFIIWLPPDLDGDGIDDAHVYVATSSVVSFSLFTQSDPLNPPFLEDLGRVVISTATNTLDACDSYVVWDLSTVHNLVACMFQPTQSGLDTLAGAVQSFKGFFPFNIFFNFNDVFQSNLTNLSASSSSLALTIPLQEGNSFSATVLTPTTFYDKLGTSTADFIFTLQRNIFWVYTGFKLLALVL